jgi:hypothetical protein
VCLLGSDLPLEPLDTVPSLAQFLSVHIPLLSHVPHVTAHFHFSPWIQASITWHI